jgi:hypothetical protein
MVGDSNLPPVEAHVLMSLPKPDPDWVPASRTRGAGWEQVDSSLFPLPDTVESNPTELVTRHANFLDQLSQSTHEEHDARWTMNFTTRNALSNHRPGFIPTDG